MGKQVAIVQSCYIPWKGYFDLINSVDEFVLFDNVQYTRRDWRNRNLIKTPTGPRWLTVPVEVKGRYLQKINEVRVSDARWGRKHWAALVHNYSRAKYFRRAADTFEPLYSDTGEQYLSRINHRFITTVCGLLGITTRVSWSTDYETAEGRNERLISLCRSTGANRYLSGPSAAGYLDRELFARNGIEVSFIDYEGYREYTQLHGTFDHRVTVLDLLFNEGPDAARYLKTFGSNA